MFINYSNHPTEKWSDVQKRAALAMTKNGQLIDLPFPQIDPEWDWDDLLALAAQETKRLMDAIGDTPIWNCWLHIMGEQSFCAALMDNLCYRFGAQSVRFVVSTTKRIVVDNLDGTKSSRFEFVRFRRVHPHQRHESVWKVNEESIVRCGVCDNDGYCTQSLAIPVCSDCLSDRDAMIELMAEMIFLDERKIKLLENNKMDCGG